MPQDDQEGQEYRCQTRLAAQADALDGSLQRLMDEALADLDGWIE